MTASTVSEYQPGDVVWANLDPTAGSEQRGNRPVLIVSSAAYNDAIPNILIVIPVTTVDRGWLTHVSLRGPELTLDRDSFAMSEQPRTIDRKRITMPAGRVDDTTLSEVRRNLARFLEIPSEPSTR